MPREIWSEGRVVGYSAYEIYVKQHLSEDPETVPATEREWLASSLAMGSSMLLRVPDVNATTSTQHTYVDIPLPSNSKLAAANTIVAQFFDGSGVFESAQSNWAVRISDYGSCISNTAQSSPNGYVGPGGSIPSKTPTDYTDLQKTQLSEYLRIYDGVFIQPGTWVDNNAKPPQKDFQADLSKPYPRIRLHVRGKIKNKPLILLTGFTIRSVLAGTVGQDTCTETGSPQDGDFLGPAVFPWAAKVVFCVPNSYVTYFASGAYERTLNADTAAGYPQTKEIKDTAVIDMQATKPETFYDDGYTARSTHFTYVTTNPKYPYNVNKFTTLGDAPEDGEAVLTVYQKSSLYPPAMFGTFVGETGAHYLNPLDVVAPGTVKMFFNRVDGNELIHYEDTFPGTTAMNRKADGTLEILDVTDPDPRKRSLVQVAGVHREYLYNNNDRAFHGPVNTLDNRATLTGEKRPLVLRTTVGRISGYSLMVSKDIETRNITDPSNYAHIEIDQKPTAASMNLDKSHADDMLFWSALLQALAENRPMDLLGERLRSVKNSLIRAHGSSNSEGPYIEFGPETKKIRLYISNVKPSVTDVPIGSIGIGWGFVSPSPS